MSQSGFQRVALCTLVSLFAAAERTPLRAADAPDTIECTRSGYTVSVLDPGPAKSGVVKAMTMHLPAKDGFASNVGIQHQAYAGSIDDYAAVSTEELKKLGIKAVSGKTVDGAHTTEAIGKIPGIDVGLHFYFKAIKVGDNIILATATIPSSRWDTEKGILIPIVDSLTPIKK